MNKIKNSTRTITQCCFMHDMKPLKREFPITRQTINNSLCRTRFFFNSGRHKNLCDFFLKDSFWRNNSFLNSCRNEIVFDKRVCIKITLSGWYSENLMSTRRPVETCRRFERSQTKIITNISEYFTDRSLTIGPVQ